MARWTLYIELFLLSTLSRAYVLSKFTIKPPNYKKRMNARPISDGLTSFQLPHQQTVVLENNGTKESDKRINFSSDHKTYSGSLGATWGNPKNAENPLTMDHKRVKRAVSLNFANLCLLYFYAMGYDAIDLDL